MARLTPLIGILAALAATAPAHAALFLGDYTVSVQSIAGAPDIVTTLLGSGQPRLSFDLAPGGSVSRDLFTIHSEATEVEALNGHAVTVDFQFTAPSLFGGTMQGETIGHDFSGIMQWGQIVWSNGGWRQFDYDGGQLLIRLNNANFNKGVYGLRPGESYAGVVTATFSLSQATALIPSEIPGSNAVPEPSQWAMMIAGFALVGAALRRRRIPQRALSGA